MAKLLTIFPFLFSIIQCGFSQESMHWGNNRLIKEDFQHSRYIYIDTLNADTLYFDHKNRERIIISKEGVELVHGFVLGGMGTKCGCEPEPHGLWIKKHRNGNFKEVGEYSCNKKTGTWTYYHENGNIAKIETYKLPYFDFDNRYATVWDTLKNRDYLRTGLYAEFHSNGKRKIEGRYDIVEAFSPTDTVITGIDGNYRLITEIKYGSFWHPQSVKIGVWTEYNEKGKVTQTNDFKPIWADNNKYRAIIVRYFELLNRK
jgi:antitoxin component YwqK of YwqJK toxin-antitoxin module